MRILVLFLLSTSLFMKSTETLEHTLAYLLFNSLNNKTIAYNQTTLNRLQMLFNDKIVSSDISSKAFKDFIKYGEKEGFDHKTQLGLFVIESKSSESLPSLEKVCNPFALSNVVIKIKLIPKPFQCDQNENLEISIQLLKDIRQEPSITMTPGMKTLLKEIAQKAQ